MKKRRATEKPYVDLRPSINYDDHNNGTWLYETFMHQRSSIDDESPYVMDDDSMSLYKDYDKIKERLLKDTDLQVGYNTLYQQASFVESFRVWEGTVLEIKDHTFIARLVDNSGVHKTRIVEMQKDLVNRQDWDVFFRKDFEFEWVFQRVNTNGTIYNRREIRFTPVPDYYPDEIDTLVRREMNAFAYLLENNND